MVNPLRSLIARFMGPTWGPSGADRTQVGSMLAPMNFAIWDVSDKSLHHCRIICDLRKRYIGKHWFQMSIVCGSAVLFTYNPAHILHVIQSLFAKIWNCVARIDKKRASIWNTVAGEARVQLKLFCFQYRHDGKSSYFHNILSVLLIYPVLATIILLTIGEITWLLLEITWLLLCLRSDPRGNKM